MNKLQYILLVFIATIVYPNTAWAQQEKDTIAEDEQPEIIWEELEVDHAYAPLALKLSDDGKKFVRFLIWHQQWFTTNNLAMNDAGLRISTQVRRSRFLAFAQVSPRFLILTHFGVNNLNTNSLTATGRDGNGPQLFLHDAWSEYKLSRGKQLFVGAGLHYWKGMTRMSNESTLNFMILDNSRPFAHWHSLGITDQFARHLGIYIKGEIGPFDYRIAVNNPLDPDNALNQGQDFGGLTNLTYNGANIINEAGESVGNTLIEGYFRYDFLEKESTKLPFQVGTYFGQKKVFGIGAGFFAHPDGMYNNSLNQHQNVFHYAVDAFLDHPVGNTKNGISAYASLMRFDYGENYMSRWAGTGTNYYTQAGFYFHPLKLMPYVSLQVGDYQAFNDNIIANNIGINYLINQHHAKITLDYYQVFNSPFEAGVDAFGNPIDLKQVRLQFHVFL